MTAANFLDAVYGALADVDADLFVPVVRNPGFAARFVPADHLDQVARLAAELDALADTVGVYVNVAPLARRPTTGRGSSDDTGALVALWADLDLAGPGHGALVNGRPLPPDYDAALDVVDLLGLEPTAVVDTGFGLHCWWALDVPWVFDGDQDRAEADHLAGRWADTVQAHAADLGYGADHVGDLARLLRVPGTHNRKPGRDVRPVELITCRPEVRYTLEDFADALVDMPAAPPPRLTSSTPSDGAYGPAQAVTEALSWADVLEPHGWRYFGLTGSTCDTCGARRELWSHRDVPADHRGRPDHPSAGCCHGMRLHSNNDAATGLRYRARGGYSKFTAWAALNWPDVDVKASEAAAGRAVRQLANSGAGR